MRVNIERVRNIPNAMAALACERDEEHAGASEEHQQNRIEESEHKHDNVLVNDGRDSEGKGHRHAARVASQFVEVKVHVFFDEFVNNAVPFAIEHLKSHISMSTCEQTTAGCGSYQGIIIISLIY